MTCLIKYSVLYSVFKSNTKIMKTLLILFAVLMVGCSNPIGTDSRSNNDNVPSYNNYPKISVTDTNNDTEIYDYAKIWYADGCLNIDFPECQTGYKYSRKDGCGVTYPFQFVKSFTTL